MKPLWRSFVNKYYQQAVPGQVINNKYLPIYYPYTVLLRLLQLQSCIS
jgi:hypothetical protein